MWKFYNHKNHWVVQIPHRKTKCALQKRVAGPECDTALCQSEPRYKYSIIPISVLCPAQLFAADRDGLRKTWYSKPTQAQYRVSADEWRSVSNLKRFRRFSRFWMSAYHNIGAIRLAREGYWFWERVFKVAKKRNTCKNINLKQVNPTESRDDETCSLLTYWQAEFIYKNKWPN